MHLVNQEVWRVMMSILRIRAASFFPEGLATGHRPSQNTDMGQHFQVGNPALGLHAEIMGSK